MPKVSKMLQLWIFFFFKDILPKCPGNFFFLTYQNKLTLLFLIHIQECPFHL